MNQVNNISNKGFFTKIRNYLLTGLIVTGPLILTTLIIMWLVNLVDSVFNMIIKIFPSTYIPNIVFTPGFGVIVVLCFLILVGMLGKNFFGRYIINFGEAIVSKLPFVKFIYSTIKQIFNTIFSSQGKAFKSVVLVEFPTKDSWTIGFLTSEVKDNIITKPFNYKYGAEEFISVFVPATPNPTSGFLLYVLKKNVINLDISPNVAMKIILSGGMLTPNEAQSSIHKLENN